MRRAEDRAFLSGVGHRRPSELPLRALLDLPVDASLGERKRLIPGTGLRVLGVPGIPEGSMYAVDRIDMDADGQILVNASRQSGLRRQLRDAMKPKCSCGADAWISDRGANYCGKCFRTLLGLGKNEFVVKDPPIASGGPISSVSWRISASPPRLREGQEALAADGRIISAPLLGGQLDDGGRVLLPDLGCGCEKPEIEVFDDTQVVRCSKCGYEVSTEALEATPGLTRDERERLEAAANMVIRCRDLLAEAERIRREALTPEVPHEVLGFRYWEVNSDWRLAGAGVGRAWDPIPEDKCFRATCNTCGGPAPCDRHADSGFNVYSSIEVATSKAPYASAGMKVLGAVLAWTDTDRFFVHNQGGVSGFRAERARVVALAVDGPRPRRRVIEALAEDYGAVACPPERLGEVAREFGDPMPEDVLAWAADGGEWRGADPEVSATHAALIRQVEQLRSEVGAFVRELARGGPLSEAQVTRAIGVVLNPDPDLPF
jgi:hypothetical protein